jgi:hypothetical protein
LALVLLALAARYHFTLVNQQVVATLQSLLVLASVVLVVH